MSNLTKCPSCGAAIKRNTKVCPECGHAIESNNNKRKKKDHSLLYALAFFGCLLLMYVALSYFGEKEEKAKGAKTDPKVCAELVLSSLANGDIEGASKLLNEYSNNEVWNLRESYVSVISAYVHDGEIEKAKKLCDKYLSYGPSHNPKHVCVPVYSYLISNGLYEEAEKYIPYDSYDYNNKKFYYEYLESYIIGLCENGEKDKAKTILKRKAIYFSDFSADSDYAETKIVKKLSRIIDTY